MIYQEHEGVLHSANKCWRLQTVKSQEHEGVLHSANKCWGLQTLKSQEHEGVAFILSPVLSAWLTLPVMQPFTP